MVTITLIKVITTTIMILHNIPGILYSTVLCYTRVHVINNCTLYSIIQHYTVDLLSVPPTALSDWFEATSTVQSILRAVSETRDCSCSAELRGAACRS